LSGSGVRLPSGVVGNATRARWRQQAVPRVRPLRRNRPVHTEADAPRWRHRRLCGQAGRRQSPPEVGTVVGPDVLAVSLLAFPLGVVVGGLADLAFSEVDVDLAGIIVDPVNDPGRQYAHFAEDPEAGIDDDVTPADVVGGGIEVADGAVGGDDLEAGQISGL
jgi:hypothetical protein